jgi:hypothetical protein
VHSARSLPAELPSYAKSLVGDSIRIIETRVFGPAAADGRRDGTIAVDFSGAPMAAHGTLLLAADGIATIFDLAVSLKASVPLIGGKLERLAADQIQRALAKEEQVAGQRLG